MMGHNTFFTKIYISQVISVVSVDTGVCVGVRQREGNDDRRGIVILTLAS